MSKIRVGVLFGGRSGEHEVSLVSGNSVIEALDKSKYEIIPIGITKTGRWLIGESLEMLKEGKENNNRRCFLPAEPDEKKIFYFNTNLPSTVLPAHPAQTLDVIIPVLHGTYGEDGTIQGLLELAGIPYVGAGVLGSALCMDKIVQKQLCSKMQIPVVNYLWIKKIDWEDTNKENTKIPRLQKQVVGSSQEGIVNFIIRQLKQALFVKPANLGSSVGISKVHTHDELGDAIENAFQYDNKVIIESEVPHAREIEVSILGNERPKASVLGEVIPSNEFYDYDAKYIDGSSKLEVPAQISPKITKAIQNTAIKAFLATEAEGMARVDFLLERKSNKFYLNELNTIPGFTKISMYPKLWEYSGLSYTTLLDELINLAMDRFYKKQQLRTTYTPKSDWHKK